jgi:hypothetical protein
MPVKVDQPPLLSDFPSGRFAISGNVWIKVPDDTKFEDLDRYMIHETAKRPESPCGASERAWAVVGSKGAHYTVRASYGRYTCTCKGFGWRHTCKHIDQVKKDNRDIS